MSLTDACPMFCMYALPSRASESTRIFLCFGPSTHRKMTLAEHSVLLHAQNVPGDFKCKLRLPMYPTVICRINPSNS